MRRPRQTGSAHWSPWVDWSFLLERDVGGFAYNPLVPPDARAFMTVYNANAVESGLTYRSLLETARDMYAEFQTVSNGGFVENFGRRSGLPPDRIMQIVSFSAV